MGLETGTVISDLVPANPAGSDFVLDGDDHIRLIKSVLQLTFPGDLGGGFAIPITASEVELNYVEGVTSGIQAQIDAIVSGAGIFPSGTVCAFFQAAPPPGWTQVVTHANAMMRVVSGSGGGSGGTDSPISASLDHTHTTANHTLVANQIPSHSHLTVKSGTANAGDLTATNAIAEWWPVGGTDDDYRLQAINQFPDVGKTSLVGGGLGHNHGNTGSAVLNFAPMYVDMIIASLD